MNNKVFRQYEGPWAKKPYPTRNSTMAGCGCGVCACTHIAIEQEAKKDWTPETLRKYMISKGYAVAGQGTTWDGITQTLKYLGYSKVTYITESTPMKTAFAELNKGNRIGIFLFYGGYSTRKRKWYTTPDGTVWTNNGHYVAFTDYRYKDGKHWFYTKDSGARNHDGWRTYESSMKGCVGQMWIVERIGKQATKGGKLKVDGIGGVETISKLQKFLNVPVDGLISSQNANYKKFFPALKSVSFDEPPRGSITILALQEYLKIDKDKRDGILKKSTVTILQRKLEMEDDSGTLNKATMKELQKFLNNGGKVDKADRLIEACKKQARNMKYYEYGWESNPTYESTKKKGTCVSFVGVALQLIKVLKSGQYIWHNGRGYGDGKVYGDNNKMVITYMKNKPLKKLKKKLKKGDIVMFDDNKSGQEGGGGHILILRGDWKGNDPYVYDNHSCDRIRSGKSMAHTYSGDRKVLAIGRLK